MKTPHRQFPEQIDQPVLPPIDIVVIGVNAAATLGRCLSSIFACGYPLNLLTVTYVDGGSTDSSCSVADNFSGVAVIALNPAYPTPGLGRNAGWRSGRAPLVQFLDSDTVLAKGWLESAVRAMPPPVAAVVGRRIEMHPEKSVFNWIADQEWNAPPGPGESFGGDVLIRRSLLEQTGGYDEELVGGEDPELSQRVRAAGGRIEIIDVPMTYHDLAMTTVRQYLRRAYRSGYAFAALRDRLGAKKSRFWRREYLRIVVRGGGTLAAFALALLSLPTLPSGAGLALSTCLVAGALLLLFSPRLFRVDAFRRHKSLATKEAKIYAWHCSLVVLPDIFGVLRYHLGKFFGYPLRNRHARLATSL